MSVRTGIAVVGVMVLVAFVGARPNPGGLKGIVTNDTGTPLPGVTVSLRGAENRTVTSGQAGDYTFTGIAPGQYHLHFTLTGYTTVVRPATVHAGRIDRLDAKLTVTGAGNAASPPPAPSAKATRATAAERAGMFMDRSLGSIAAVVGQGAGLERDQRYAGPFNTEAYDSQEEHAFRRVTVDPLSTFSIDVDTASYANVRRFLNQGSLPPAGAVRIEELVNYFRFDYAQPQGDTPFSIATELAPCPWNPKHRLALIGLQGRALADTDDQPRNLVFLLDVSGSMSDANKLPLVRAAMQLLVETLTERDRVAIVVYAGASGLVLPSTSGDQKAAIQRAIAELEAGGSTNGAEGITLAYQVARQHFIRDGVNRVVLATDGDFNVGVTSQDALVRLIERERASGVFLSVLGVGEGNLKDSTMEKLADKGNGNYSYLDSIHEARKVLVQEAGATLVTIAKDVKIQVEFNPAAVGAYRLIGYENRMLRHEEFNDDKRDAGEIGAGHSVTAIYEIVPPGVDVDAASVDPLKYQNAPKAASTVASDELVTVKLRYKMPDGETSRLTSVVIKNTPAPLSANLGFASAVAEFGMLLRQSKHAGGASFAAAIERARKFRGSDPEGYRSEFIKLAAIAQSLRAVETSARRQP